MTVATISKASEAATPIPSIEHASGRLLLTPSWAYALSVALALIFFAGDVVLPRGATVAIGFCLVPAVAAATRRRRFMIGMTLLCTGLTWIAFFTEDSHYSGWKSAFDRAMVSGVLWLALLLVLRRLEVISTLIDQALALRHTSEELERSNTELERFAFVVAHDLRGPLNSVGLQAELLSGAPAIIGDAECGESVGSIQAEVTRMSRLIQSLLTYGRIGSGEVSAAAKCDCAAVLAEVRQNLKADLSRHDAQITGDGLPLLHADPVLIGELFQNLIENSIKYRGAKPPRIHVSAEQRPDGWLFSVRDNGIGVRAEDFGRIFEPFRRAGGVKGPGGGVGLGLATCKRIVERHGGRIDVESTPGEGTTFLFTIPQADAAEAPESVQESLAPTLAG